MAHQYAQTLAYHFRSQVQEMSVGAAGTDRFPDEDRRTGFATMIFREVQRIASQLFQRNNTGVVRQIQQIDTTGMQPVLAQYTLAVQSDSVRLLEELVKQIYQTLIEPTSTKFRLQTYSTKVHATLQDNPSAAGTHCVFDSDENFDSFDRFAGVRMQLELNTLQPTGDSITDLRTRDRILLF